MKTFLELNKLFDMNGEENEQKNCNIYSRRSPYATNNPRRRPQKGQASGSIL